MKKKFMGFYLTFYFSALALGLAETVSLTPPGTPVPTLDATTTSPFSSLWGAAIPEIKNVNIQPAKPRARQRVEITAEIGSAGQDSDLVKPLSARLSYSTDDGRTWTAQPMRPQDAKNRLWKASIPAQKAGARVQFFIQAQDSFNGITTEIPTMNTQFPPNLARMQRAAEDADDPDDLVPPELDLLNTYVGYDTDYLYVTQSVQGSLEKGSLSNPPAPCLYFIALMNMDDAGIHYFSEAPMLVYSPMGRLFNLPTYGLTRADKLLRDPKSAFQADADVQFSIDRALGAPTMHFKVKRSALGENPSRAIKLVSFTLALTNLQRPQLIPWEASPFGLVYLRAHEYQVQ